jgi:uncharacterized protein
MPGSGFRPDAGRLRPALKLTESCNLACRYCYQEGRLDAGQFMSTETLERILSEVAGNTQGPMHLLWYGGEPTLFGTRRFADALERSARAFAGRPLYHGVQTNATLIDQEWADLLAAHRFAVTARTARPGCTTPSVQTAGARGPTRRRWPESLPCRLEAFNRGCRQS